MHPARLLRGFIQARKVSFHGIVVVALLPLSACLGERAGGPLTLEIDSENPVVALQTINEAGAKCWFASGNRNFRGLKMIPELDTTAGRPRILLLRSGETQGLPRMVIEASGSPVKIVTYGPLTSSHTGAQVNTDIMRWSGGANGC